MIRIAALLPVVAVAYGLKQHHHQSKVDRALLGLKSSGFRARYQLEGSLLALVDDTSRKIAFVSGAGVQVHGLDELRRCDWLRRGPRGPGSSNAIEFTFKDERSPSVTVRGLDETEAERWMERMDVLLSGW